MAIMKNLASYAEIALWDTAISLMSSEKTRRIYSQTVAAITLRIQPVHPQFVHIERKKRAQPRKFELLRLIVISIIGLLLGTLLGWLIVI
jgi:hypothetical protein